MNLRRTNLPITGTPFIGNFLNASVRPGNIYFLDDRQYILEGNLTDYLPAVNLNDHIRTETHESLRLISRPGVSVSFAGAGTTALDEDEVQILLATVGSGIAVLRNTTVTSFKPSKLINEIRQVWLDHDFHPARYILVTTVVKAESGMLIYAGQKNAKVVLRHRQGFPLSKIKDLNTGKLEYVINTQPVLENMSEEVFLPLYKAVKLKRNGQLGKV
jgi:hypothetical protein